MLSVLLEVSNKSLLLGLMIVLLVLLVLLTALGIVFIVARSEEHTSELQSH